MQKLRLSKVQKIAIHLGSVYMGPDQFWNRYEIDTDSRCVYTGSGGSDTDRICYLVPNGCTYEGDPMRNRTVPV